VRGVDALLTLAGLALILLSFRDVFHSLLHPNGEGSLSRYTLRWVWRLSRATGHRMGSAAGPTAMVLVILGWVLTQALGWALVYLPHIPEGFLYSTGIDPGSYSGLAEALYLSLVSLSTVGFGDAVPVDPWMRLASPLESLTGLALLTAALTWFTQVYPPLSRRRALALELCGLRAVRWDEELAGLEPAVAARVLDGVTQQIVQADIDLTQHPETYYFRESDPKLSLAAQATYALVLRDAALASASPTVVLSGRRLGNALGELGRRLAEDFSFRGEDLGEVFAACARDQMQVPVVSPTRAREG